jgi:glycerol-3-phosphate dehydrogenase
MTCFNLFPRACPRRHATDFPSATYAAPRMRRVLSRLSQKIYDVAVIGGGIYGISVARDAAMRGLTVALVDKGDFGSATSANNHKIIHGGLRYLQHADLKRMRESIRERHTLMRIAPHLVSPLPFLIPTYERFVQGKTLLWIALKLNDLIGLDRNQGLAPEKTIPGGRIISQAECVRLCPALDRSRPTGGALFFDAQVYNADRLNLSLLLSSVEAGADVANYAQAIGFLRDGNVVAGVQVQDALSGESLAVRARVVVNCTGPWTSRALQLLRDAKPPKRIGLLKAAVLVTRPVVQKVAVGVPSRARYRDADALIDKGHRYFFITPWRNTSLIGTFQAPCGDDPDDVTLTEQDLHGFIHEVNEALPGTDLKRHEVSYVYCGLLPGTDIDGRPGDPQLVKEYQIYDHALEEGLQGLVSVLGVKYTTARGVAEKAVDLVQRKLRRSSAKCRTASIPVYGGAMDSFEDLVASALNRRPSRVGVETLCHLLRTYGSAYQDILQYGEADPRCYQPVADNSPVIGAQVLHGIRGEMAQTLGDIIFRRTELGTASYPGSACLKTCAEIMAAELGWDRRRVIREIDEVEMAFGRGRV